MWAHSVLLNTMNEIGPTRQFEPKDSVRRVLTAAGVTVPDKKAFWLGFEMERFVRHTRKQSALLDLSTSADAYLAFIQQSNPPLPDWKIDEIKQAIHLFARAIEGWRWEQVPEMKSPNDTSLGRETRGAWQLKYRIKASGTNSSLAPAVTAVSSEGPPVDLEILLQKLRRAMRLNHYSIRTEQAYTEMVRRFLLYTGPVVADALGESQVKHFLEHLALERQVSASTQNQAFSAVLFFFKRVLGRDLGNLSETIRAKRGRRLPTVLSRDEIRRLLAMTDGTPGLMLRLIYGAGLRLMERIRLRVRDISFERGSLLVRAGKGNKDRTVMLPDALREPLRQHFERLRVLWKQDVTAGIPGVWLPGALAEKYPKAGTEFGWQWVFPAKKLSLDPRSGLNRRHHVHDNTLHKAVKVAAQRAGLVQSVSAHTLRHSFALIFWKAARISARCRSYLATRV